VHVIDIEASRVPNQFVQTSQVDPLKILPSLKKIKINPLSLSPRKNDMS